MVELIWDGKYDEDGQRAAPLRVALPFQTVETVNESAQQRQMSLESLLSGRDPEWRNRLIWGDKKYVLPSLLPEFAGKVDLIYIDPPFATGQDFSFQAQVGEQKFEYEAGMIEQKAYRDTWGQGLDSFLAWIHEAVLILHELLSESGSLYIHLDQTVSHYAKTVVDSIFGPERFKNEVVWIYGKAARGAKGIAKQYARNNDVILFYTKSLDWTFNPSFGERVLSNDEAKQKGFRKDERGWFKTAPRGDYTDQSIERLREEGRIYKTRTGSIRIRYDLPERNGMVIEEYRHGSTWDDIADMMHAPHAERTNYPTQKPEALLERIIRASSNEGDLVLDCFCGSGTTPAVAEKLKRRWIACDLGRFAIHTSRKRLLGIENVRPFVVQNLGKYERQVWQKAEFGAEAARQLRDYRQFILELYHAELMDGYTRLHGRKGQRFVHVGSVDSPIAEDDARQIALEVRRAAGGAGAAGVDVLGWDFALDMNETAQQIAAQAGIDLRFLRIPREVLEPKAVEQGDIRFFELAALDVAWTVQNRELSIELTDFMAPPDDVPDDVRAAVHSWEDWIDYWAVDFDYRDDAFHNQWQSYRARKDRSLLLRVNHKYSAPGDYVVMVKVIDILGNDTTKTITVQVE